MNREPRTFESGVYVRVIYSIGLALMILPFFKKIRYALQLFEQLERNPNIVNPVLAIVILVSTVLVIVFLGKRLLDIARGALKLKSTVSSKSTLALRYISIALLSCGVSITVLVFASLFLVRGGGQVLIAGSFYFTIPLGLVLFELSRLREFEAASE